MTKTQLETQVTGGDVNILEQEKQLALDLQRTLPPDGRKALEASVHIEPLTPFDPNAPAASTDVGDVSWNVPTIGFETGTFVPGVAPHTSPPAS